MALPASGAISLNAVNVELGILGTTSINMNQASVRTLFAVASGAIAMSNGHGKSAASPPVFPSATMTNFAGGGTGSSVANYSVNDRTVQYWNAIDMDVGNSSANNASNTNTFPAATGGGISYEWQFLPYYRFYAACTNAQNTTPLVGSAQTWNGPSGYNDSISGASSNSLTLTGFAYLGTAQYHGVAGFWRLKASNSAGATYTGWIQVGKIWGKYSYSCNCTCPAGESYTYDCNCYCGCGTSDCDCNDCCTGCCDENNENCNCDCTCGCWQCCNCSETCDTCNGCYVSEVCDTCDAYQSEDYGYSSVCGW